MGAPRGGHWSKKVRELMREGRDPQWGHQEGELPLRLRERLRQGGDGAAEGSQAREELRLGGS